MLALKTVEVHPHAAQAGDLALVADHLTKRFGDRMAVDGLSLTVPKGEVFGFLGRNAAGKTTTVRMLGTIIAPTSGSAVVASLALCPENGVEIRRSCPSGLYRRAWVSPWAWRPAWSWWTAWAGGLPRPRSTASAS